MYRPARSIYISMVSNLTIFWVGNKSRVQRDSLKLWAAPVSSKWFWGLAKPATHWVRPLGQWCRCAMRSLVLKPAFGWIWHVQWHWLWDTGEAFVAFQFSFHSMHLNDECCYQITCGVGHAWHWPDTSGVALALSRVHCIAYDLIRIKGTRMLIRVWQ